MTIRLHEKLAYGLGDFASGLVLNTLTLYLMFFYTDTFGISAAAAGTLLFVARTWDAFVDLGMGAVVDRTRSRWGQARPYMLFGAPLLALAAVATFTVPGGDAGSKLVYAWVSYCALMMAYSLVNIPYSALPGLMSDDSDQRSRLAAFRMFFAFSGWLTVSAVVMPLIQTLGQGDKARGYQLGIGAMATVAMLLFWVCFAFTRERVQRPRPTGGRASLLRDLRALAASRAWRCTFVAGILVFMSLSLPSGLTIYFINYVAHQPAWIAGFFVCGNLGMIAGVLASDRLTRHIDKRSVVVAAALLAGLVDLMFLVVDPSNRVILYSWFFVGSLFKGATTPIVWAMIADTADSIEADSGRPVQGLASSTKAFAAKLGLGVGGGLGGVVLAMLGYQAGRPQTPEVEHGLVMVMALGPAACNLGIALAYTLYPLTRSRMLQVRDRLLAVRQARVMPG